MTQFHSSTRLNASNASYILCLDGVRATSILLVLAAHTFPIGPGSWSLNAMAGRMGMALFFCLSGYLIVTMLYRKPKVMPFLAKRVMRIVPALFLYVTVLWVFFDLPVSAYVYNVAFVSNYFHDGLSGGPVGHLWSLCVEMHFYVGISLAVLLAGRNAVWLVVPVALLVTYLRIQNGVNSSIVTHLRADEILAGGWLALASYHYGERLRALLQSSAIAAIAILAWLSLFMIASHDLGAPLTYLRPYFAMLLVGTIMHCRLTMLLGILESRVSQYIAKISYALYIWHPLMVFGFMNSGSIVERYLFKRPISWILTWIAAHLSTFYWEARFQRAVRRWLSGRKAGRN